MFGAAATNLTLDYARWRPLPGGRLYAEMRVLVGGAPASGNFSFTLPAAVLSGLAAGGRADIGAATMLDGGSNWYGGRVIGASGTGYVTNFGAHDLVRTASPFTWATTDELFLTMEYRFA